MTCGTFLKNQYGYRGKARDVQSGHEVSSPREETDEELDALLALARQAGMLVTLDGQIGREKYQSVAGSVSALQRFVAALHARFTGSVSEPALACPTTTSEHA
ncbi:hypothetical protein [Burkholderia guangdongensis]|uniref:hypothetical protein n=1 Tax=Burkholderia guangdongensis TaxID=1792500 RepID=UPI0015C7A281